MSEVAAVPESDSGGGGSGNCLGISRLSPEEEAALIIGRLSGGQINSSNKMVDNGGSRPGVGDRDGRGSSNLSTSSSISSSNYSNSNNTHIGMPLPRSYKLNSVALATNQINNKAQLTSSNNFNSSASANSVSISAITSLLNTSAASANVTNSKSSGGSTSSANIISNGHGPKKKGGGGGGLLRSKKSNGNETATDDDLTKILGNNNSDKKVKNNTNSNNISGAAASDGGGPTTSSTSTAQPLSKRQIFLDIVKQSNISCQNGDYSSAIKLYTEALKSDPNNHILYSNRSAALLKLGYFNKALQDANKARDLHPKWAKAYYRQGVALQCLGKHAEAIAAFSSGLAEDPKSGQLLAGLLEASVKSPLKGKLEPTLAQLHLMNLTKSPFVISSVIGQELLAEGHYASAAMVLENALKIGTNNIRLNGSVLSALSSAYWALNSLDKAINYMQQDLAVAKSLGDVAGECRAHGNLGSAYFTKANYKDALTSHRYQLVLAMKCKDTAAATAALTSLGHVYTAIGDYANALASHKQCVQLVKQLGNILQEAREIGNVGAVYLVMGDFANAIDCHLEHLRLSKELGNKIEEARAYSNLGSSYHYQRNYEQAIVFHNHVLQIAHELSDQTIEARAYAGLGHAARCVNDLTMAKLWHEKQLDMALATKDKICEGRACSNLGIIYQLLGDFEAALKLHQVHLNLSTALHDRGGMGRAFGNIGNAYNSMGYYEQAVKYYKKELNISKEVNDRSSEASTHGNLAIAFQAMHMYEKALVHYHSHLNISRELKESSSEACALLNLGNCHSSFGDFMEAIPFYENYLMLSQELHDIAGEEKACHLLGFIHYSLGNYREAVRYYNQDLILAKDCNHSQNIGKAYCNLGLTYLALGNYSDAIECQTYFLNIAESMKCIQTTFRALANLGNILVKMGKLDDGIKIFQKQIILTKNGQNKSLEAAAYSSLGMIHRLMKKYDYALGFHTQELALLRETNDVRGQCRAHGNLGSVYMSIAHYPSAIKSYEEMLIKAKQLSDSFIEGQAYGNLGIARMNIGNYEDAATYFEQQLIVLESLLAKNGANSNSSAATLSAFRTGSSNSKNSSTISLLTEQGSAYSNLGDCFTVLCDYEESIRCYQKGIEIAINTMNSYAEEKCSRSIAMAYKLLGNAEQTIHWLERRLAVALSLQPTSNNNDGSKSQYKRSTAGGGGGGSSGSASSLISDSSINSEHDNSITMLNNDISSPGSSSSSSKHDLLLKAIAYQELGLEYQQLRNSEQAISCFQQQLSILRKPPKTNESLGLDLDKQLESATLFNLGQCYYQIGNYSEALKYFELDLSLGTEYNSTESKLRSYRSIGLVYESLNNFEQALMYQEQHLGLATKIDSTDEKLHAFCCIGRLQYALGNQIQARAYLQESLQLVEKLSSANSMNGNSSRIKQSSSAMSAAASANNSVNNCLREEEATIQYFLGLVLWKQNELESAEVHLEKATQLLEAIQQDTLFKTPVKKTHFPMRRIIGRNTSHNSSCSTLYSSSAYSNHQLNYSLQLYDRQIASYQTLQRILVSLGKTEQTLLVAEKCRTIANSVLHHQQQQTIGGFHRASQSIATASSTGSVNSGSHKYYEVKGESLCGGAGIGDTSKELYSTPYHTSGPNSVATTTTTTIPIQLINSVDALLQRVNRHRTAVLYYSITGSFLFAWLLIPDRGIVKFHEFSVDDLELDGLGINIERHDDEDGSESGPARRIPNESNSTITSLFNYYVQRIRTALGIDYSGTGVGGRSSKGTLTNSTRSSGDDEAEQLADSESTNHLWAMHMEELGDRLNHEHDRTGFLRMISRNHRFNCSSYSLSSLFSVGSTTGSVKSIPNSTTTASGVGGSTRSGSTRSSKVRSRNGNNNNNNNAQSSSSASSWHHGQSSSCIRSLYQILIAPFDEELNVLDKTCFRELYLVLENDLFLVPFSILRNSPSDPHFYERFKLIVVPSVSSIRNDARNSVFNQLSSSWLNNYHDSSRNILDDEDDDGLDDFGSCSLVVGAPALPPSVAEQWSWCPIPRAENEASMVAELLQASPLIGPAATKSATLSKICSSTIIHFATHISWRLSGIVLSPTSALYGHTGKQIRTSIDEHGERESTMLTDDEGLLPPILSDYLLTAADLLNLRLRAKLVVLSSCHTRETQSILNSECITSICRALLASGVSCVLIPLWPVPEIASKIFFRSFYSALLQGARMSTALSEAISTVQHTKHFAHPANWSGYLLIGSDIKLTNKSTFSASAIWEMLKTPQERSATARDALRVTLHLVEKSLQRINNGQKTAMYTTQKSIETKIGSNVKGWKDILISVGFRFEPASNDLPAAVFFPQEDLGERLVKCSSSLQAILGLPSSSLNALVKIFSTPEIGSEIVAILRQAIASLSTVSSASDMLDNEKLEIKINVKLWGIAGCHELLASLGFDLIEVSEDEVILGVGPHVVLKHLHLTLEATISLCEAISEMDEERTSKAKSNLERKISLESLDNLSHTLSNPSSLASPTTTAHYMRQQLQHQQMIGLSSGGGGAFTSYVRNRGEPDGHTSLAPSLISGTTASDNASGMGLFGFNNNSHLYGTRQQYKTNNNAMSALDGRESFLSHAHAHALGILRADSSCSSESSSMLDWENNGLATIRMKNQQQQNMSQGHHYNQQQQHYQKNFANKLRRGGPPPPDAIPYENQHDLNKSLKRVTWNVNDNNASNVIQKAMPQQANSSISASITENVISSVSMEPPPAWLRMRNSVPDVVSNSSSSNPPLQRSSIVLPNSITSAPAASAPLASNISNSPKLHDQLKSSQTVSRELSLCDVYHERNIGLDLAPSLSKLILANQISAGQLLENEQNLNRVNSTDIDAGAISMDDTISTFDQLSLAEDSAPESSVDDGGARRVSRFPKIRATKYKAPVPMRRTLLSSTKNKNNENNVSVNVPAPRNRIARKLSPPPPLHHLSINLSPQPLQPAALVGVHQEAPSASSTSSSSKSSPSDLSRRDEADGRSLTDSQYGSYSPSMAQNTIGGNGTGGGITNSVSSEKMGQKRNFAKQLNEDSGQMCSETNKNLASKNNNSNNNNFPTKHGASSTSCSESAGNSIENQKSSEC